MTASTTSSTIVAGPWTIVLYYDESKPKHGHYRYGRDGEATTVEPFVVYDTRSCECHACRMFYYGESHCYGESSPRFVAAPYEGITFPIEVAEALRAAGVAV